MYHPKYLFEITHMVNTLYNTYMYLGLLDCIEFYHILP